MDVKCKQLGADGSGDGYRAKRAFKDVAGVRAEGATTWNPGGCSQLCAKTAGCNYWIVHNTKGCFMHKETEGATQARLEEEGLHGARRLQRLRAVAIALCLAQVCVAI